MTKGIRRWVLLGTGGLVVLVVVAGFLLGQSNYSLISRQPKFNRRIQL